MHETELAQVKAEDEHPVAPAPVDTSAATAAAIPAEGLGGLAKEAKEADDGYGYDFANDPLNTGALGDGIIRFRPGPVRTTFMRTEEDERKAELRKRFMVGAGGKAPNAVSEAEFEKIAALYEHIWDGDENLKIDTSAMGDEGTAYKANVMEQIARMLQTGVGRKQLQYLTYGFKRGGKDIDHQTVIKAGPDKDKSGSFLDDVWAKADSKDNQAAALDITEEDGEKHVHGAGAGTDSTVLFNTPGWYQKGVKRADVVLAHELTHSLTQIMGIEDTTIVGFEDNIRKDVSGTDPLMRAEHQAAGLGKYRNSPWGQLGINERNYVAERNAIGRSGQGEVLSEMTEWGTTILGDDELRARESYRNDPNASGH